MTERLTLKKLSTEIETLRTRVMELEQQLEQNIETTLEKLVARLGARIEPAPSPEHGPSIDTGHRQQLIAQEAYLIAEQRGFQGGDPAQDWAEAEKLVNERLMLGGNVAKSAPRAKKPATKKAPAKTSRPAK